MPRSGRHSAVATPFVTEMPQLAARLGAPHGPGDWAAYTEQRQEVLARRLDVSEANASTVIERLRWVHEADHTGVRAVLGAATGDGGVWLLLEPRPGVPLAPILAADPLTPAEGVAVALDLLQGMATLHRVALGQETTPDTVLLDPDGRAHLDGSWAPVDGTSRAGQVRSLGLVLCDALGVSQRPGQSLSAAERQAPALVATLRGLATGSAIDAATAQVLVEEAAGGLAAPPQLERSRHGIGDRIRRLLSPPGSGTAPRRREPRRPARAPAPPKPVRIGPRMSKQSAWRARPAPREAARGLVSASTVAAGAVIGLILLVLVFGAGRFIEGRQQAANPTPTPRVSATPAPTPTAIQIPTSAPPVSSITMQPDQVTACSPGAACAVRVQVNFSSGVHSASWVFEITNECTGKTTEAPGESVTAYPVEVYATTDVPIPAGKKFTMIAKTTDPAVAASQPMAVGGGSC